MNAPITDHQARIARRVLDAEEAKRAHLVISLTGAHAYGFASPDSDLDLKGVHVLPTSALVGLVRSPDHASFAEVVEGVEIDYASNEIGQVLNGVLRGFGSYIERVLGPWPIRTSSEHHELRDLVRGALSQRVHAHYRGFAAGQHRAATAARAPTAKRYLYVLRTALTGAHLLRTRELVTDLGALMDDAGFGAARELLEVKTRGERTALSTASAERWARETPRVFTILDEALERSVLPEEPANRGTIEDWLLGLRRRRFEH